MAGRFAVWHYWILPNSDGFNKGVYASRVIVYKSQSIKFVDSTRGVSIYKVIFLAEAIKLE